MFRENDPAVLEGLALDIEWRVPDSLPHGGELHGQWEVLEFWDAMSELFEDAYPDPEEFLPAGDKLVVLGTWRAVARATGVRVEVPFAHVVQFRDGKLASFRGYMDSWKALRSLEEPASA